jgi:hypothetical protein
MYTIIDLIDKLSKIDEEQYYLYLSISENTNIDNNLKIMAKVLFNEEKKHLLIFQELKENSSIYSDIEIDFATYDRSVELIYEFSKIKSRIPIINVHELFKAALIFEKENLSLLLIVQGLLIKSYTDIESRNYIILSKIIEEEQKHIDSIESILK